MSREAYIEKVKCPFYNTASGLSILCEGSFCDTVRFYFKDSETRTDYMGSRCIAHPDKCPNFLAVQKKYGKTGGSLYFQDSKGERTYLRYVKDNDDAVSVIDKYIEKVGYKSPYLRIYREGNEVTFDVGSWSQFFKLVLEGEDDGNKK